MIIEKIKNVQSDVENQNDALKHAIADMLQTLVLVEAERDRYRQALEVYASEENWALPNSVAGDPHLQKRIFCAYSHNGGYDIAQQALGNTKENKS